MLKRCVEYFVEPCIVGLATAAIVSYLGSDNGTIDAREMWILAYKVSIAFSFYRVFIAPIFDDWLQDEPG